MLSRFVTENVMLNDFVTKTWCIVIACVIIPLVERACLSDTKTLSSVLVLWMFKQSFHPSFGNISKVAVIALSPETCQALENCVCYTFPRATLSPHCPHIPGSCSLC